MDQQTAKTLVSQFEAAVETSKGFIRERDFAKQNGITEADIFTAYSTLGQFEEFAADLGLLLTKLDQLGAVMIITRNDCAVHQLRGSFEGFNDEHGIITTFGDINLSIIKNQCHRMFFKTKIIDGKSYACLAIFDHDGVAVLKLFEQPNSNHLAWQDLIVSLRNTKTLSIELSSHQSNNKPELLIDGNIISNDFLRSLIEYSIKEKLIFHCRVSNPSCCQSFSGIIHNFKIIETWFNIMDGNFNLHINMSVCHLITKKGNKKIFVQAKNSENIVICEIRIDLTNLSIEDYFDHITYQYGISKQ